MFHGKAQDARSPPAGPPPSQYPWFPPMPPVGYGYPGWQMPSAPPAAPSRDPVMSSDPPDDAGAYPSVTDFIEGLIARVPQRQALREAGEVLDSLHYYDLNEITSLTAEELGSDKFGSILRGDAEYLLTQARREVKRLDKVASRARAARH